MNVCLIWVRPCHGLMLQTHENNEVPLTTHTPERFREMAKPSFGPNVNADGVWKDKCLYTIEEYV